MNRPGAAGPGDPAAAGGALSAHRRGRWLAAGVAVYLAILAAVALGLWQLHREARARLDAALGGRLIGIAVSAAHLVDGDSIAVWSLETTESLEFLWLSSRLERLRRENDLAEIALSDAAGRILISSADRIRRGEPNVYWHLDRAAVSLAQSGFPAASRLYRTGDVQQKSAHAPVLTSDGGVAAVLTVEGDADFFTALAALRRAALATGLLVLLFLSLMGWLLLRLHRALESSRAAVWRQENLAAMGRMTAAIAHEIRNPLGIIRGAGQHLAARLREAGLEEDAIVGFIPAEVDRLDRILKDYLAFGVEAPLAREAVDLGELARRTARLLAPELAADGVRIEVDDADGPGPVPADPRRLQQVLLNLLLNARDASPAGGLIRVRVGRDRGQARLEVEDEGAGLGGRTEAELFAPFRTTKEKGSGLGLTVARQIAAAHGGALALRERGEGRGAVAELRLPLAEPAARPRSPIDGHGEA